MTGLLRDRSRGVTMLEVMVVIGIMSILFTMGTMYYRGMQNRNAFQNEVERFGGELRNMGTLARASGDLQPALTPRNDIALGGSRKAACHQQVRVRSFNSFCCSEGSGMDPVGAHLFDPCFVPDNGSG